MGNVKEVKGLKYQIDTENCRIIMYGGSERLDAFVTGLHKERESPLSLRGIQITSRSYGLKSLT